jgi:2-deoxy-D-gluconate 3-dehydrogenase
MLITEETMPEVIRQYREIITGACERAKELYLPSFVAEIELLPPTTYNPQWGIEITKNVREIMWEFEQKHGIKSALRITPVDIREDKKSEHMWRGSHWDAIMETFEGSAKAGADLVISAFNSNWDETKELIEKQGRKVVFVQGDLTKKADRKNLVDTAMNEFGKIDILVNNAGTIRRAPLLEYKEEDWTAVMDINLNSVYFLSQEVAKIMAEQKSGKIVNVASVVGLMGNAGQGNYAASKAGIIGFTKSLARELASRNINVNAVAPGFIATMMTENLPESARENLIKQIPLQRLGKAEDVADLVGFLVSDKAAYITGQTIAVDGGMVMS